MVQFNKIRLTGFKSFVDPTELGLSRGLTGIVGPNGCGKSNILEAFRWCMGEGSARQLRGGGMDDVIFNGTADRPARNIAEVSIDLDNSAHDAPAGVNGFEQIDVTRRIERESGSATGSTAMRRAPATSSCCLPTCKPGRGPPPS